MVNNQGIIHAAHSDGGAPICKNRNAHASAAFAKFRTYGASQCKRCAAKLVKMDAVKAKAEARAVKPVAVEKFANWPLVVVIQVNAFSRKICSGYHMRHGVKAGATMSPLELIAFLRMYPETPVEFLSI
jgi:hypothetical protein